MFGWRKRKRFERVSSLELPPGQWERAWTNLRQRDVMGRVGLALLAAAATCAVIRGWDPPFAYRTGYVPARNIVVAVPFTKADPVATAEARQRARSQARYVYCQDAGPLVQLQAALRNTLVELTAAPTLNKLAPKIWKDFQLPRAEGVKPPTPKQQEEQFLAFREAFMTKERLEGIVNAVGKVFAQFEKCGLLENLDQKKLGDGNKQEILVYPKDDPTAQQIVRVSDVQLGKGDAIRDGLGRQPELEAVADRLFAWLFPQLKKITPTLTVDEERTKESMAAAALAVEEVFANYTPGQELAPAGKPLGDEHLDLLSLEYATAMHVRHAENKLAMVARALAVTSLIAVCFLACGVYMRFHQRGPLVSLTRLIVLLLLAMTTIALARLASANAWRGELVPLLLFCMTMAIVYQQRLAILMAGMMTIIVVLAVGHGFSEYLLLIGVTASAVLNLRSIRNRSKLIHVGLFACGVAIAIYVALALIDDQPLDLMLLKDAARNGLWALAAAFFATGLLPFIEQLFGVLTDLSLLELGDVAHPLLQELVRRAPSTYNHSVTVGSIAEAAAESINARGLLVRVGAYFHDIGKMLKPAYFIENQGPDDNRHETLVPAMSTLVIIAHIKDGADLARQHRLPQPIIDLIAQHHGTTRVEFFFGRATEQQLADPNSSEVDESSYRYPGPKPQTKEAAVLMLADAVESASRTLVDPTPARIESLVREIAENRLHGGQFDESGLTLRELRTIEKSMVMSLTSIYHGRIKYPEQKTA